MRNKYFFLLTLVLVNFIVKSVNAQNGFDAKKKKTTSVNASSLHAKQIDMPSRGASSSKLARNKQALTTGRIQRDPHIVLHAEADRPSFIESKRDAASSRVFVRKEARTASFEYLEELAPLLRIENAAQNFVIQRTQTDQNNGTHVRMQQLYHGVPVHGGEVIVHLNSFGEGEAFNGRYILPAQEIDVNPTVDMQTAIGRVKAEISRNGSVKTLNSFEIQFVEFAEPEATLCIYEDKSLVNMHVLAYHVQYSPSIHKRYEYFIDAHTGNVLSSRNTICFADGPKTATAKDLNGANRTVNSYQIGAGYYLLDASRAMYNATTSVLPDQPVGAILTVDMNNTFGDNTSITHLVTGNNVWNAANHAKAVSAHFNAGKAYEYFLTKHGRSSINGKGGTMISFINVVNDDGKPLDNAFWNGKAMYYGNGDKLVKPMAGSLDVAGHEMTHGVIQNTANLEYQGESGALNESLADIFGCMMDPEDWKVGEDVVKLDMYPSGAARSLEDPHNGRTALGQIGYQPMHMNEKYNGTEDNGGVHINSGIVNHAFYKYAQAITREKAAAVFYKTMDDYLTKSSQFIDMRLAVIKAAGDLYGATSNEVTQAGLAFDAVGITNGQGGDYEDELPENPGSEFLLVYNTDDGDANTLYRVPVSLANSTPLTKTDAISRPSVTDDGSGAVFVAADKTIHAIVTTLGQEPNEYVIQNEAIWSNVAISKDGNRLAAVTEDADNRIYVYDFEAEKWVYFTLYNPTYSDGINSGGTEYADALEWDYTGEYVVYDAFNRIKNNDGDDIEYWDVNFIRTWDKEGNKFGDGTISKLFATLPEGVSIGNPTFAKLSPYILAFDMFNELTEEYYIIGNNVETGEVNEIFENETLGYPSFNKNDTRLAFTLDGGNNYNTGYVNLNADKISSPNTSATTLFEATKWAVYFAAGTRDDEEVTGVETDEKTVALTCYPNPFVSEVSMKLTDDFAGGGRIEITNLLGQPMFSAVSEKSAGAVSIKFDNLPAGQYIVRVQNGNKTGTCRAVKVN